MRKLSDFRGDNVVIGCGHKHHGCQGKYHNDLDSYYTIDRDRDVQPDSVFDIREEIPESFNERFKITLFEHIDYTAYNAIPDELLNTSRQYASINGEQGFQNALKMTHEDGFVFIIGCGRNKEFRNSIKDLKYIEVSNFNHNESVIVPKNQELSIRAINEKIQSNHEMKRLINALVPTDYFPPEYQFKWCKIPYHLFPTNGDIMRRGFFNTVHSLRPSLSVDEFNVLKYHKQDIMEVKEFYKTLDELVPYLDTTHPMRIKLLYETADDFFKYPMSVIKRDFAVFKKNFLTLFNPCTKDFLSSTKADSLRDEIIFILSIATGKFSSLSEEECALQYHKKEIKEIKDIYLVLDELTPYLDAIDQEVLYHSANDFFQNPILIIKRDFAVFQKKFSSVLCLHTRDFQRLPEVAGLVDEMMSILMVANVMFSSDTEQAIDEEDIPKSLGF